MNQSSINTPCKNCVFALYDGVTQVGCVHDRIAKFREVGVEIVEAYDQEKEFFVIKGRRCMFARTKTWPHQDKSLDDQFIQIQKEIRIRYAAIVFASKEDSDATITTLESLYNQSLPPDYVATIMPHEATCDIKDILTYMDSKNTPWKVEQIQNPEIPEWRLPDLIIDFARYPYYAIFHAGFKVPHTTFDDINYQINHELKQVAYLAPNAQGQGCFVSFNVYALLHGNKGGMSLLDKLKEEQCQIMQIDEFLNSFPE